MPVKNADSALLLTFGMRMSSNVTQWLQARLSEGGLSLTDLATLAAVIEEMVHEEADMRLSAAFRALQISTSTSWSLNESTAVLEAYMASFVMGVEMGDLHSEGALLETSSCCDHADWSHVVLCSCDGACIDPISLLAHSCLRYVGSGPRSSRAIPHLARNTRLLAGNSDRGGSELHFALFARPVAGDCRG